MLSQAILGIARHVLTLAAGAFVASGWIEASQVETVVGACLALVGVGWSVVEKKSRVGR